MRSFVPMDIPTENAWDSLFNFIAGLLRYGMRCASYEKIKEEEEDVCN